MADARSGNAAKVTNGAGLLGREFGQKFRAVKARLEILNAPPECNLCHVRNVARPHRVRIAVSNSFGFGGSNTCLVLKAV